MHKTSYFLLFLFTTMVSLAQETTKISGIITDQQNKPLSFINVSIANSSIGTVTNSEGAYSLQLNEGSYKIKFSAIGYNTLVKEIIVQPKKEMELSITLQEDLEALNEVVITTNRTKESLDEVPSSVSILTSSDIKNLSQTSSNIADILTEIPGIALSTNKTSSTGQTLRGRNMLVLIDGIPQSTPLRSGGRDINTIDPNTIERIEVIKGATAIYGNGADGGIVNYITKKPTNKEFQSTTEIGTMGSLVDVDHTMGSKISQTFSGTKNKLGYVLNGNFQQTGLYRDAKGEVISPTYGLGETNQYSLFGKFNYEFTPSQSVELMYNYYSSNQDTEYINQNGVYGESPSIGVIGEVLGVDQGNRHNHNAQLTYNAANVIGGTDLKLNLYLQDFQTVYGFSPFFFNAEEGYDGGQSTIESAKKGVRINLKSPYTLGNDISGDVLYGIDILNDKTSQKLVDGRIWAPEMDMTNFAPYVQLKSLYKDFVLKTGARLENININVPNYQTIYIFPNGGETANGGVNVDGGELKYDATTFNVGLKYNKWQIFKPFVSFSQSFSIADLGRTLRTATENTVAQISSEAVIASNYEAGFSSRIGKTRLSGAYFISTSKLGATYKEVDGIFQIARQPEKVYGFELAVDSKIGQNLSLGSSISYTEGKLDAEDNSNYNTFMNGDRIPPVKTVTYLKYQISDNWSTRISHIYSGNRDKFEPKESGDYTYGQGPVNNFNLVNLTTNYKLTKNASLGLGIENLLNEDYYNPLSQWAARDSDYIKGNGARFNLSLKIEL